MPRLNVERHAPRLPQRGRAAAFSLVELMVVVVLLGILTAAILPQFESSTADQLTSAAQIVAADLDYVRSLAVGNGSEYYVTFDLDGQRYILKHRGGDDMPPSPFRRPSDPPKEHIVDLADLPRLGPPVELAGALAAGKTVSDVEFNSLGATTRGDKTFVWLACGLGTQRRYLPVEIDPVTGLATVGELQSARPTGITR
jgi:prepilin-type N-terminal cleavage/methylation domain-containing protein